MTKRQDLIWTLLPNGIRDGKLNFTVFVSPRLSADPAEYLKLRDFNRFYDGNNKNTWIDMLKEFTFHILITPETGSVVKIEQDKMEINTGILDKKLWKQLLKPTTPVISYNFTDLKNRTIRSYPVNEVTGFFRNTFQNLAIHSPGSLPLLQPQIDDNGNMIKPETTLDSLVSSLADLFSTKEILNEGGIDKKNPIHAYLASKGRLKDAINKPYQLLDDLVIDIDKAKLDILNENLLKVTIDKDSIIYYEEIGDWFEVYRYVKHYDTIDKILKKEKVIGPDNDIGFEPHRLAALQACRFFDRQESDINKTYTAPKLPDLDFHQIHALLGDYPVVMRRLGFIIDLTIPLPDIYPGLFNNGDNRFTIQLKVRGKNDDSLNVNHYNPITHCVLYKNGTSIRDFYPASQEGSFISKGFLQIEDSSLFELVQIDTGGAMISLTNSVQNIMKQIPRKYLYTLSNRQKKGWGLSIKQIQKSLDEEKEKHSNKAIVLLDPEKEAERKKKLSILNHIYISIGRSILAKTESNMWQLTTGNRTYEIQRTQSGTFHIFQKNNVAIDTPSDSGITTLQTAGIMLIKTQRAFDLHNELKKTSEKNSGISNQTIFYADDLMRGYRVDVRINEQDPWYSLCQRTGRYYLSLNKDNKEDLFGPDEDEGYIKASSASSTQAKGDFYLHEGLFSWDGWSLAVPRPGKTIKTIEDEEDFSETPDRVEEKAHKDFPLITIFKAVEKSLPPLRFGSKYQIRVRAVDIAGNSRPLSTTQGSQHKKEITYHRFEPVASPTLYPLKSFNEGEAAERMVIRTYPNDEDTLTDETNERHVVPPKTSQLMAEKHGAFDDLFRSGNFEEAYNISLREKGILNESDGRNSIKEKDDLIVVENEQITLPYLPDVLARGVVLQNVPIDDLADLHDGITYVKDDALKIHALRIPFYDHNEKWPNAKPLRIAIEGKGTGITWDASERLLTISLEKAYKGKIRYSCYFHQEDLELMGLWDWMKGTDNANELAKYALNGCHWMLTPYRELTLVHAVQMPLRKPVIEGTNSFKELSEAFAWIDASMNIDAKSSGKVSLLAEWTDFVDDVDDPEGGSHRKPIKKNDIAFELIIPEGSDDTIHLRSEDYTYRKHEFGDTRHRMVTYRLKAISRFTDCYDPDTPDKNFEISGESFPDEVNILNSARPDSPKLKYILPTFIWDISFQDITDLRTRDIKGKKLIRKRIGGGLRVYMDRPWYSSGDGELLGVVTGREVPSEAINSYITLWGMDPIRKSKEIPVQLTVSDFKTDISSEGLTLDETEKLVDVAGFTPEFDEEKNLWRCDIQVKSERVQSYFPFIKLALARYQPHSVKGAHLSSVVQTDFIQLPNDRILAIKLENNKVMMEVEGYGPNYGEPDKPVGNDMELCIESRKSQLEWNEIKGSNSMLKLRFKDYYCVWTLAKSLNLPQKDGKYRMVIKEFEKYKTGNENPEIKNEYLGRRLVYSDIIEFALKSGNFKIS